MEGRPLPVGIEFYKRMIDGGYYYVDKTKLIKQLFASGGKVNLFTRPRRFGKTLNMNMLKCFLEIGAKPSLFDGLYISENKQLCSSFMGKYPVVFITLKNVDGLSFEEAKYRFVDVIGSEASRFSFLLDSDRISSNEKEMYKAIISMSEGSFKMNTQVLLRSLKTLSELLYKHYDKKTIILIDEYDKPMLQAIGNEELGEKYRDTLKGFYSVLKTMDGYIRFALLTGVTKFGKVSVFSDLNNLNDISMDEPYVELCGITEKEIHHYLEPEIRQLAKYQKMSYEDACRELKERYDGYHFTENSIGLYNPFSILNTFYKMKFGSYWFETGTPSYLVKLLLRDKYDLQQLAHDEATSDMLNCIDSTSKNPLPVIYQSGYLTIKGYDERFDIYRLGFPNREVEEGFIRYLLPFYANIDKGQTGFHITRFVSEVEQGDCDAFFRRLQSFFADTPYELVRDLELHYQNVLFIVYKLLGFYVQAEYHTSNGRIDMVLKTDRYIYVMEFKLDGTAEEALRQINGKHYTQPFATDGRKLFKIGVNFSAQTRNIEKWIVES